MSKLVNGYIWALAALAGILLGAWIYLMGFTWEMELLVGGLALATMSGGLRWFPMRFGHSDVDLADAAVLAAIVLLGPVWALAVAAPVSIYRPLMRGVFVCSGDVVRIIAVGFCFTTFSEPLLAGGSLDRDLVAGLFLGGFLYYTIDASINSVLLKIKYGRSFIETLNEDLLPMIPANALGLATVLASAAALVYAGPVAAIALFSGVGAALVLTHLLYDRQRKAEAAEARVRELEDQLRSSGFGFARAIVEHIGRKDGYTNRHAAASSVYAGDVAQWLGLPEERVELVRRAAQLQNIGMIACSEEVLHQGEDQLNPLGRRQLERHPAEGAQLMVGLPAFEEASAWVLCHHEREDGSGYPNRMPGAWIPFEAKIIGIAGHYAWLVLDKPSTRGMNPADARRALIEMAGGEFQYEMVSTLLNVLDLEGAKYASASDGRFELSLSGSEASSEI